MQQEKNMKHIALIALALLVASPSQAEEPVRDAKVKIAKTTSEQRALTELLSARIRSALEGEPYTLDLSCKGKDCEVSSVGE